MEIDDYQLEADKRVNAVVTEVSVIKETMKHMSDNQDKTDKKLDEIKDAVNDLTSSLKLSQYQMSEMIDKKLEPIYKELEERKTESVITKTRMTMIGAMSGFAFTIFTVIAKKLGWL